MTKGECYIANTWAIPKLSEAGYILHIFIYLIDREAIPEYQKQFDDSSPWNITSLTNTNKEPNLNSSALMFSEH